MNILLQLDCTGSPYAQIAVPNYSHSVSHQGNQYAMRVSNGESCHNTALASATFVTQLHPAWPGVACCTYTAWLNP